MKAFALFLILTAVFTVTNAQKSKCVPTTTPPRDDAVRLQLNTSILETRYSVESGSTSLRLTLKLHYLNAGTRPILLDRKSSVVYRKIVSRNLKALSACKYLYDASLHFIGVESMEAVGFRTRGEPERSEFTLLKPGESLDLKDEIRLSLHDGSKDTKDDLHPGSYVLQVRVAAWFYFAEAEEYQQKWGNEAYVWSGNVTSEPMPFTVEKSKVDAAKAIPPAAN